MRKGLFLLGLLRKAGGHSWVACTDYRVKNPTQTPQGLAERDPARLKYDDSKCFGYPRDFTEYNGWTSTCDFACDRGFNHQPATSGPVCKTPRGNSGDYTPQFPMATYQAGQVVCVAHTVKNHVAAPCTNAYIPDHGQFFYIAGPGLGSDPSMATFKNRRLTDFEGTHVIPSFDYKGFQNAPGFCQGMPDMDKATGTACFRLPSGLASGTYTFLWYWAFNSDTDVYTTCWEAKVTQGSPVPAPVPGPSPNSKPTPKPVKPPTPSQPIHEPTKNPNPTPAKRKVCFYLDDSIDSPCSQHEH